MSQALVSPWSAPAQSLLSHWSGTGQSLVCHNCIIIVAFGWNGVNDGERMYTVDSIIVLNR